MTSNFVKEEIFSLLFENASEDYHTTQIHRQWREKQLEMLEDCEIQVAKNEQEFVHECFGLIIEACEVKMEYLYHQGFKDCIILLKELKLL